MEKIFPIPRSITEAKDARGTTLVRAWRPSVVQLIGLTFFCIAWNSFLIFWYSMAFNTDAPLMVFIFPIAHLAVGVGLTYYLLTAYLNKTSIRVSYSRFEIRHHPLPWRGNRVMRCEQIEQLFITEKKRSNSYGNVSRSYELHCIDKDSKQVALLKGLHSAQEALYLEKRLEELLKIESAPVAGAYVG